MAKTDGSFSRIASAISDQVRNNTDDDGFRSFSFSIKDVLVFGTVIVSVVSAWGMVNTRMSLIESSVQTMKESQRKTAEVDNTKILKLETQVETLEDQLTVAKEHTREVEASLRRYTYMIRRMQQQSDKGTNTQ